jgi:hypothetical protein
MVAIVCGCRPPPAAPQPPPPPVAAAKPPPSCRSLDDHCLSTPDTHAPIQESGWSIVPPTGWTYAHEPDATVAASEQASVAATVYESGNRKADAARRDAALELVLQKLGVTLPKKAKIFARSKPDQVEEVAGLKISLYQLDGAMRGGNPGSLLVFAAKLPSAGGLIGAGFVAESDTMNSDEAILSCVTSLLPRRGGTSTFEGGADDAATADGGSSRGAAP